MLMFISHKSNVVQHIHDVERECRRVTKGQSLNEYWAWLDSVTTTDSEGVKTVDYSGETDYTLVQCNDEDMDRRMRELGEYIVSSPDGLVYNIKWQDDLGDDEEILDQAAKSYDPKQYVKSHLIPDDAAKDARILANEWKLIRLERDRLLTNSDWTQGADSPLASGKKTEWATYRTKLRDVPKDQKDKTTYASITWPSEPS